MKTEFKETQRFNSIWIWLILGGVTLIPMFGIYQQIIMGEQFGNNPMSNNGLIAFAIFILLFDVCFLIFRLETEITDQYIKVKFFPLVNKKVNWSDIIKSEVLNYGFVGGWGIRLFTKYGTVYNTKGKMGLAIVLRNGNKFIIGTQKPKELEEFISSLSPQ